MDVPTEVDIPLSEWYPNIDWGNEPVSKDDIAEISNDITEWLSDTYGWCVNNWQWSFEV